jgi:hypothetical protein
MKKVTMTNYDYIVADFRYVEPPLEEICSKLKPDGTLIMATIEENIKTNPAISSHFAGIRIPFSEDLKTGISVIDSGERANAEQPDLFAVSHLNQETLNKHQFAVSHVTAWKKSS